MRESLFYICCIYGNFSLTNMLHHSLSDCGYCHSSRYCTFYLANMPHLLLLMLLMYCIIDVFDIFFIIRAVWALKRTFVYVVYTVTLKYMSTSSLFAVL